MTFPELKDIPHIDVTKEIDATPMKIDWEIIDFEVYMLVVYGNKPGARY